MTKFETTGLYVSCTGKLCITVFVEKPKIAPVLFEVVGMSDYEGIMMKHIE